MTDIERRNRLWKIYFASSEKQNETIPQYYQTITSDGVTIDRIKRKLADIHRMDSMNDDSNSASLSNVVSTNANTSSTSAFDSAKFFSKRFPSLRRQNWRFFWDRTQNVHRISPSRTRRVCFPRRQIRQFQVSYAIAARVQPVSGETTGKMPVPLSRVICLPILKLFRRS